MQDPLFKHSIEKTEPNGSFRYTLSVYPYSCDDFANPRHEPECLLGIFVFFHKRYSIGDVNLREYFSPSKYFKQEGIEFKDTFFLPVYMYDHGGITISTSPFSCRWDSGKVGFIYTTKERIRNLCGIHYEYTEESIKEDLNAEIKLYNEFIMGNVYCLKRKVEKKCNECNHWHSVDDEDYYGPFISSDENNGMIDSIKGIDSPDIEKEFIAKLKEQFLTCKK